MANLDLASFNAALKELYSAQVVENMVYDNNPFLALVKKRTDFEGSDYPIPTIWSTSQGRSTQFNIAQANQTALKVDSFRLTRKRNYSLATLDNETMEASASSKGAFIQAAKAEIDGAFRIITLALATDLFGAGTGSRGQIGSITGGVIVLSQPNDVVNFEVGMTLQANATNGGSSPRAALGYVVAVDRANGELTVSATAQGGAAGDPSLWVPNDFLLVQGDNNATISGLGAWLPATAPGPTDNFYGVNRSQDATRLAGVRYDGRNMPIQEALSNAAILSNREGGSPDHCFLDFGSYANLLNALGAKIQYVDQKGPANLTFPSVMLPTPNGMVKIIPDRNCPADTAFLLSMKSWTLMSLKGCPRILSPGDGLEQLRVYNQDAAELRVGYYANLACNAPGHNARVQLGS